MTLVVSGCYQQARNWGAVHDGPWAYVPDTAFLARLLAKPVPAYTVVFVGDYYNRDDITEVEALITAHNLPRHTG